MPYLLPFCRWKHWDFAANNSEWGVFLRVQWDKVQCVISKKEMKGIWVQLHQGAGETAPWQVPITLAKTSWSTTECWVSQFTCGRPYWYLFSLEIILQPYWCFCHQPDWYNQPNRQTGEDIDHLLPELCICKVGSKWMWTLNPWALASTRARNEWLIGSWYS